MKNLVLSVLCGALVLIPTQSRGAEVIVETGTSWKVRATAPSAGWNSENFDESGFSAAQNIWDHTDPLDGYNVQGIWDKPQSSGGASIIWLRKQFSIQGDVATAFLDIGVDDDAVVYINGNLVISDTNHLADPTYNVNVAPYLQQGDNLIAVKAMDYGGAYGFYGRLTISTTPFSSIRGVAELDGKLITTNFTADGRESRPFGKSKLFKLIGADPITSALVISGTGVDIVDKSDGHIIKPFITFLEEINTYGATDRFLKTAKFFGEDSSLGSVIGKYGMDGVGGFIIHDLVFQGAVGNILPNNDALSTEDVDPNTLIFSGRILNTGKVFKKP